MRRFLGVTLVALGVAGCGTSASVPAATAAQMSVPSSMGSATGATSAVTVAAAAESEPSPSTSTTEPTIEATTTTTSVGTTTTAPDVDVDLSELDALLDDVERVLGSIDLDEDEGDLP